MIRSLELISADPGTGPQLPTRTSILAEAVVLVCEPDEALRFRIGDLLRSAGFATIVGAPDIAAAAGPCAVCPPDVVLYRPASAEPIDTNVADALKKLNPASTVSVLYLHTGNETQSKQSLLAIANECLSLDRDLEELPRRVLIHATLRATERALLSQRNAMDAVIEKRTDRLNQALDLLSEAEQRLQNELSDAKSETRDRIDYFAETQHELRTPLNAICGMSDAIRREMFGALDNPKYKDYAENIFQSGQHLLSIIDGRLEMSRIEAGVDPLEVEPVDIGGIVNETKEMLGALAETAKVALEINVEPDLPTIGTDRRKLRQVLVNLVSNAIKFTPENGRVALSVKRNAKKGVLELVVSDTGIGMSPEDMREAVKPYCRLSGDRRSGERGMGLGLTIVRKLVETLGATIEIQSKPGRGTSIQIELPMSVAGDVSSQTAAG